jgi:hypothetical protein
LIPGQHPLVLHYKTALPPRLTAGDSLAWSVHTHLTTGASVFLVLTAVVKGTPTRITIGGSGVEVDDSGNAAFTLPSSTTEAYLAGKYDWVLFALDSAGDRSQISSGVIYIAADPAGAAPIDPRTDNEKLLANIKNLLQGKALDDVSMYKIGTRELEKMPIRDLLYWEGIIESRVRRERIRRGQKVPTRTVGISFGGR